jgi:Leishmanolysin
LLSKKGIGTLWVEQDVTGPDNSNCPYRGTRANAEYKSITGCNVVPTENDGSLGDGTFCGHWDEGCLKSELMTGYLNSGLNPLSRISIASLEDLGYSVDYSSAESYTRNDVLSSCRCGQRLLSDSSTTKRRSLSPETYGMALEYGRSILKTRQSLATSFTFRDGFNDLLDDVIYVGDKVVMVFVEDGGVLFDVMVQSSD